MFLTKRHAMTVYGIADAKHDTVLKSALRENQAYLHVYMSLTLQVINRSLKVSQSVWTSGGNTNSCDFTMNKLHGTKI
jgi:hypothetical protein